MKNISFFQHPSGLILRIKASPNESDWRDMHTYLSEYAKRDNRLYVDLNRLRETDKSFFSQMVTQIEPIRARGMSITFVRTNPDFKDYLHEQGISATTSVLEYLDEALFPQRSKSQPPIAAQIQQSTKAPKPKPKTQEAQKETPKGREQRRSTRESISLPFFYTQVVDADVLQATWNCAVTEEMDIRSFSGLGFFVRQPIIKGRMLKFIFPTVFAQKENKSLSTLTIFSGRVKNCITVGRFHRIGVALIDVFEYEGKFEAHETEVSNT